MIRLGLTGGIGAGKSTVARIFTERGAYLIDADKIAREVVEPGTPGLAELVEAFGAEILDDQGVLNRPALAAKAFADEESRQRLNGITHPRIGARTQQLMDAAPADAIILQDMPLLVESHAAPFFHLVVLVGLDAEIRLHRLTTMRGLDEADARARIVSQATDEQRRAVADVWLDNSGTPAELAAAATAVWEQRLVPLEANVRLGRIADPDPELVAAEPNPGVLPTRLTNRLWALAGGKATGVTASSGSAGPELAVTARDAEAAAALREVFPAGGFPAVGDDRYASADPGRPAVVVVTVG